MKQATKKELARHTRPFDRELGHSEGNCWCDCLTRGYRHFLGLKLYGSRDIDEEMREHYDDEDDDELGVWDHV